MFKLVVGPPTIPCYRHSEQTPWLAQESKIPVRGQLMRAGCTESAGQVVLFSAFTDANRRGIGRT